MFETNFQLLKSISELARRNQLYLITNILEESKERGREKTTFVFNQQGIAEFVKPNCKHEYFSTNFGVNFLITDEQKLMLLNPDKFEDSNIILVSNDENILPFMTKDQYLMSLSQVANVNIIAESDIYSSNQIKKFNKNGLVTVALCKHFKNCPMKAGERVFSIASDKFDIDDYILYGHKVDLNLAKTAANGNFENKVCHNNLCCDFKLSYETDAGSKTNYSLMVFDGMRQFGSHNIGVQTCAIFSNTIEKSTKFDQYKTKQDFKKVYIRANFTSENAKIYPVTSVTNKKMIDMKFDNTQHEISITLSDNNLLLLSLINRVYDKDRVVVSDDYNITEYFFHDVCGYINEELINFFDSLWILIRIPLIVVSIYVLEML